MDDDSYIDDISKNEILFFPSGDVNEECLESLLNDAHTSELNDNEQLNYYISKRTDNFNPDYPTYESIKKQTTVGNLKRFYLQTHGFKFTPSYINHDIVTVLIDIENKKSYVINMGS